MFAVVVLLVALAIGNATPASATDEKVFNVTENSGISAHVGFLQITGSDFR